MGAAVAAEESMTNTDAEVARHDVIIGLLRMGMLLRIKYADANRSFFFSFFFHVRAHLYSFVVCS